jgi:hypothetical protein
MKNQSSESRIIPWGRSGLQTDGQTDKHDEAKSRFFRNFVGAPKNSHHRTDKSINRNLDACQNFQIPNKFTF